MLGDMVFVNFTADQNGLRRTREYLVVVRDSEGTQSSSVSMDTISLVHLTTWSLMINSDWLTIIVF